MYFGKYYFEFGLKFEFGMERSTMEFNSNENKESSEATRRYLQAKCKA